MVAFQLVSLSIDDEENMDPDMSIAKQVYQTLVLAERTIEVQKLIQSNTDSMSVQLKATENMRKNSKPASTN